MIWYSATGCQVVAISVRHWTVPRTSQAEVSLKKGWIISQLLNKMKINSLLASFLKNGMNPDDVFWLCCLTIMQQVAAANNMFLSSAILISAAGDNSWIFMTPGQKQFGAASGEVLVQRIATPTQRWTSPALRYRWRSARAATTILTISAQRMCERTLMMTWHN